LIPPIFSVVQPAEKRHRRAKVAALAAAPGQIRHGGGQHHVRPASRVALLQKAASERRFPRQAAPVRQGQHERGDAGQAGAVREGLGRERGQGGQVEQGLLRRVDLCGGDVPVRRLLQGDQC